MTHHNLAQFAKIRIYAPTVRYSPDGSQIAHITDESGQFNLWLMPSGGGERRPLTFYTDHTVRDAYWSPDGREIAFIADQNGDEQYQIYRLEVATGTITAHTQNLQAQHYLAGYSPDGQWLAYSCNAHTPTSLDVIIERVDTGEQRRLTEDKFAFAGSWSPDSRYLTLIDFKSNTDQSVLIYEVATGQLIHATPHQGEISYTPGDWSPDSQGFYLFTNDGREYIGIGYYHLADRRWEWAIQHDHDVEGASISKNGRIMAWSVNEQGRSKLHARDLTTGEAIPVPNLPMGVVFASQINPDGTRLAMIFARPGEASNLSEFDLQTGELHALGQSMIGGIDPAIFIEPELITYPTFDGRQIPAWLYRPKQGRAPYPVIVSIHGGPEAQERPTYNYAGLYQYLLNRGFAILAPNIRGSTGFGVSYQKLIHRDWGGAELKDIEHAAKYLQTLDWIDANRIGVFGGSFGGFATLSALSRLPQYWACGVDVVGPSNLITFVQSVPPTWRRMMKQWVGDPEEDRDLLIERSPITYVDQIRAPLLVIQGAKDPRVVQAESDQLVERLRQKGGDVQYYVDEQEGHGATRAENRLKWNTLITEYLEEQLLDEPSEA
ncbi:MAG: S9 family peptidase [Anaerolineae bacterium]|jgi:dipeptidyl aminopeptidase/acylaminoacyl peptidase|nr:S9 family peptidase [Anaerolineae bacterium]